MVQREYRRHFVQARRFAMFSEEYQLHVWKAGEIVPAGKYVRIDDCSYRPIMLDEPGPLPATFDGHVALYNIFIEFDPRMQAGEKRTTASPVPG
jgi:hypothetical protein